MEKDVVTAFSIAFRVLANRLETAGLLSCSVLAEDMRGIAKLGPETGTAHVLDHIAKALEQEWGVRLRVIEGDMRQ